MTKDTTPFTDTEETHHRVIDRLHKLKHYVRFGISDAGTNRKVSYDEILSELTTIIKEFEKPESAPYDSMPHDKTKRYMPSCTSWGANKNWFRGMVEDKRGQWAWIEDEPAQTADELEAWLRERCSTVVTKIESWMPQDVACVKCYVNESDEEGLYDPVNIQCVHPSMPTALQMAVAAVQAAKRKDNNE